MKITITVIGFLACCVTTVSSSAYTKTKKVAFACNTKEELEGCTRDVNIELADDGAVRLRRSVMIQDEQGATHYNNIEALSVTVHAKKQFVIEDPACEGAQLYVYRFAENVCVNGSALRGGRPHPSTGWQVWDVPPALLRKGINEFVFSGGGQIVIEQSLFPNRSAKSLDGGKSWDFDRLGFAETENGEYLSRLRLAQYPRTGSITSGIIDLVGAGKKALICPRVTLQGIGVHADCQVPDNTRTRLEIRTGSSPTYDPAQWSEWRPANTLDSTTQTGPMRYLQWRAVLETDSAVVTPTFRGINIDVTMEESESNSPIKRRDIRLVEERKVAQKLRSFPFAYQPAGGRIQHLRERYKLDEVIAKGKTELEKFVALREWVRFTAPKGWDSGTTQWCPPWDALIILETNKQPIALCMCTHYSTVFVQCALALGYNARHVILDHHCIAEVWSNQFRKWIVMDTGCSTDPDLNCHFEKDGVPLNSLEIHNLWKAKRTNEIDVVYTPPRGRINGVEIGKKNQCGFDNFRRFAIPFRNNHLITPFPGELEQGQSEYYCDLYLWWEDQAVPTQSPEYGKTSCREADFYWTLNETSVDLQEANGDGVIHVSLNTVTPNFDHFIVSLNGGPWEIHPSSFAWRLRSGENTIRVKSVNAFGIEGVESFERLHVQ